MAEQVGVVSIGVRADTKQFESDLEDLGGKAGRRMANNFNKAFTFAKAVVAFKAIQKGLKETVGRAMDVVESENLVRQSFENMAGAATEWSRSLSDAVGLNEFELRKNAASLFLMAENSGLARDEAFKFSTELTAVSRDLASLVNIPFDQAFQAMQSGLAGQTRAFRQLNIFIDEAQIKQEAYQSGLAEQGRELTQTQKMMARYQLVMKQTGKAQGDLARTINDPANQLRVLQTRLALIGTYMGKIFMPIVRVVLKGLNDMALAVLNVTRTLADLSQALFGIQQVANSTNAATAAQEGLAEAVAATGAAAKKGVAGFDEINELAETAGAGGGAAEMPTLDAANLEQVADITGEGLIPQETLDKITEFKQRFIDAIPVIKQVATILGVTLLPLIIKTGVQAAIAGAKIAAKFVASIVNVGVQAIVTSVQLWSKLIAAFIQVGIKAVLAAVSLGKFVLAQISVAAKAAITTAIIIAQKVAMLAVAVATKLFTAAMWLLNAALAANPIVLVVLALAALAAGLIYAWHNSENFRNAVLDAWEKIKKKTAELWSGIKTFFLGFKMFLVEDIPNAVDKMVKGTINMWKKLKTGTINIFKGIWNGIKSILNLIIDGINKVIEAWNGLQFELPEFKNPFTGKTMGGGNIGVPQINKIPHLADGGLATGPTFAEIGEGKHKEAVLPLSRQVMGELAGMITSAMSMQNQFATDRGSDRPLVLNVDGRTLARVTIPYMNAENERLGARTVIKGA